MRVIGKIRRRENGFSGRLAAELGRFDFVQFVPVVLLLAIGELFIWSIGRQAGTPLAMGFYLKQLRWIAIGGVIYALLAFSDYRKLELLSFVFYLASLILLLAVPFVGVKVYGAQRWLDLYYMRFQPSETAKMALIMALSALFANRMFSINSVKCISIATATVAIPFLMIVIQPDLGSALILLPIAGTIAFVSRLNWKYFVFGAVALLMLCGAFTANELYGKPLLRSYHRSRISVFFNPESDPLGKGYNSLQSKLAVGSGGLFGKGIGNGEQNTLGFLPQSVSNNDFIFSVIAEETGFAGTVTLIGLYMALLYSMLRCAATASDEFGKYLASGTAALFFSHAFVNIGMSVGLLPVTGLPLPFVSYGGSFILTGLACCGLLQSVYRHRNAE